FLQDQYAKVNSVSNDRTNDWSCGDDAQAKQDGTPEARGQSNCFIVGRLIMVNKTGGITTMSVNGAQTGTTAGNDVAMLVSNYTFGVSAVDRQDSSLEWGAKLSWPVDGAGPTGNRPAGTPRAIW